MRTGKGGEGPVGLRMGKVAQAHGADAEGDAARLAQDLATQVALPHIHQNPWAQRYGVKRGTIGGDSAALPRRAVDLVEHHPGQAGLDPRPHAGIVVEHLGREVRP